MYKVHGNDISKIRYMYAKYSVYLAANNGNYRSLESLSLPSSKTMALVDALPTAAKGLYVAFS